MNTLIKHRKYTIQLLFCLIIGGYSYTHSGAVKPPNSQMKSSTRASTSSQVNTNQSSSHLTKAPTISAPTSQTFSNINQKENEYLPITFDLLGDYIYQEVTIKKGKVIVKNQIPDNVKSLNGKKVSIRGYFYPVEIAEGGVIKDFMLLRNQIYCCFGHAVQINEWISVTMNDGKSLKTDYTSTPITIYGKLEVGEKYENNFLSNLYRMKVDRISVDK